MGKLMEKVKRVFERKTAYHIVFASIQKNGMPGTGSITGTSKTSPLQIH